MGHHHDHDHHHEHIHSHDGVEHSHPHTHDGEHVHTHDAGGKNLAVLTYMLDHNIHHCAELKEMAAGLTGEAQHQLLHAVEAFDEANHYLHHAIEELKK